MDDAQIGAISNEDENMEMELMHDFWLRWAHTHNQIQQYQIRSQTSCSKQRRKFIWKAGLSNENQDSGEDIRGQTSSCL